MQKKGGTIVVTNIVKPDINYISNQNILQDTESGKLFSIQTGDKIKFNKIEIIVLEIYLTGQQNLSTPTVHKCLWSRTRHKNHKNVLILVRLQSGLVLHIR